MYYSPRQFVDDKAYLPAAADVEKPLPMIYQSGYLTIKGVKRIGIRNTYKLNFPQCRSS